MSDESRDPHTELYAEIGKFIVDFEALLQLTRDTIASYYAVGGISEFGVLDILMHDSTSHSLSKYFSAISLHVLKEKHSDKNEKDVSRVATCIKAISRHIQEAGELRNDIVHSSYELSSIYGSDPQLEARRSKITSQGITYQRLNIKPQIFSNAISQIWCLLRFIQIIGDVIVTEDFNVNLYVSGPEVEAAGKLNFVEERKRLFVN